MWNLVQQHSCVSHQPMCTEGILLYLCYNRLCVDFNRNRSFSQAKCQVLIAICLYFPVGYTEDWTSSRECDSFSTWGQCQNHKQRFLFKCVSLHKFCDVVLTLCAACRWIHPDRSQLFWFGSITWQTWKVCIGLFCSSISVIASHWLKKKDKVIMCNVSRHFNSIICKIKLVSLLEN